MIRVLKIICIGFVICLFSTRAVALSCSEKMADLADSASADIKTWDQLYKYYNKFGRHCPEVAKKSISDDVAELLSHHWGDFRKYELLTKIHPDFEEFVLQRLYGEREVLVAIDNLAEQRCPKGLQKACEGIRRQVKSEMDRKK